MEAHPTFVSEYGGIRWASAEDAGWGYGPIMRPAWVIDVANDWNNFVYPDEAIVNPSL